MGNFWSGFWCGMNLSMAAVMLIYAVRDRDAVSLFLFLWCACGAFVNYKPEGAA